VSFGTGAGSVRSHEQAVADLYREVRDRTGFGTRLIAVAHRIDRSSAVSGAVDPLSPPRPSSRGPDPVVEAAYDLMDAVDTQGQLLLDVGHAGAGCKLSFAPHDVDAGARRCLLPEPEHAGPHDMEGRRQPERKFGP
jgi:hypothetical protein